ncbi:multi antimicrobial extrusion protein MatE [Robertmurraya sp. P23]|uniref:multi antimicrobial extrusion protein MatE n=1 Tax=Robertmurraya sp. P23 TaxID=3436931 RepID=UPI003D99E3B0
MKTDKKAYTLMKMLIFFIPLAVSASLTSISHVIINGTLSRSDHAEMIIANYAIAVALFGIIERPVLVFRQMSSTLAKGRLAFDQIALFFWKSSLIITAICLLIGLTKFGDWVFEYGFQAESKSIPSLKMTFLVLSGVILFSGLRCLYQGVIIEQLETKWITIGVVIRLLGMFAFAGYLTSTNHSSTSMTGAMIFLVGMAIESVISVWRGIRIVQKKPKESEKHLNAKEIRSFYFPLVFYLSFQTLLIPGIYALLAKINDVHLGIASFALAFSITNLILSFFMYTHQMVLQFYQNSRRVVIKCVVVFSIIPTFLLGILCFTPMGLWFMITVLGTNEELARETLQVLVFFIIKTAVFPWVDYFGGILMLRKNTKSLLIPQVLNIVFAVLILFFLVDIFPSWNGKNGSIAASIGELIGLIAIAVVVSRNRKHHRLTKKKVV